MSLLIASENTPGHRVDRSFDSCMKCTACSSRCPVASVRPDFPGPKQCGPDGERLRLKSPDFLDDALKYCTGCKRCEVACPSDVKISDIIAQARAKYGNNHFKWREFLLSHTDLMGTMTRGSAPLVNTITKTKVAKVAMDKVLGIDQRREFPPYATKSFRGWYKSVADKQKAFDRQLSYFHGCFVNFNLPELGQDTLRVLNAMGIGVQLLKKEKCCGVPLVANGFNDKALSHARFNTRAFEQALAADSECIISTSSSCAHMLRDDYPHMLGNSSDSQVHQRVIFITRFLAGEFSKDNMPELQPVNLKVGYHSPCHLIRSGGVLHTLNVLRAIPGLKLHQLNSNCCGIAGTYGFKKENYTTSQEIGEPLFRQIDAGEFDYIVTDCETCKMQIEMSTSARVIHPVSLLAMGLKDKTME